jgi:hypothetical protein
MGDLKDQLRKSGLVSDKRAKQVAHEERSRKKKLGRDATAREKEQQEAARREREKARRESDRQREQQRQQQEQAAEEQHRLAQLVESNAMRSGVRGPRRFHFVTRERSIPFLAINEQTAELLQRGHAAICEVPDTHPSEFVVIPNEAADRVRGLAPELIRFYQRS